MSWSHKNVPARLLTVLMLYVKTHSKQVILLSLAKQWHFTVTENSPKLLVCQLVSPFGLEWKLDVKLQKSPPQSKKSYWPQRCFDFSLSISLEVTAFYLFCVKCVKKKRSGKLKYLFLKHRSCDVSHWPHWHWWYHRLYIKHECSHTAHILVFEAKSEKPKTLLIQ